jgi:hypothetical protein
VGESVRGLILRYYPGIRLEGVKKTTKNLRQDSRSPVRDLNLGPLKYKAGVLTAGPQRSVQWYEKNHKGEPNWNSETSVLR